jgi:DNA-directed RNA polymerase specialized sigma24 family protein
MVRSYAMSTLREIRQSLVEAARRYSRVAHEVEDLAHDIILSALRRGSTLDAETFLRSAHGAARRHGAFLARSAGRRRARETWGAGEGVAGGVVDVDVDAGDDVVDGAPLSVLSPTLRTTLFLLFLGLEKAELRLALGVTDAALRKRFQALREHGPLARPDLPIPTRTPALAQLRRRQVKLLPRLAARGGDRHAPRVLAASDPDGHGLIFAEALTPGRRTATFDASATNGRTRKKGNPCSTPRSRTSLSSS